MKVVMNKIPKHWLEKAKMKALFYKYLEKSKQNVLCSNSK